MTDLKDVKIQLIATQLRLKRANDLLLKYREADFREPILSAKVDDHFAKCRDSVRNFEQAKMDVIMEIADAIWDLKPGEVEQWVALKAAEGGVLEEVDRISEQSLVETITAGGLFADVCMAQKHRRCVSDGSYTPTSELQLEKLHKAFAQVKENPDSVVQRESFADNLQIGTWDITPQERCMSIVNVQFKDGENVRFSRFNVDNMMFMDPTPVGVTKEDREELAQMCVWQNSGLAADLQKIRRQLGIANDANSILEKQVQKLSGELSSVRDEYNQALCELNTLLAAWVQATKDGAHGLLVELLVERTEEVLG